MMRDVIIYTDGGCQPNPGVGGWGAIILRGEERTEMRGGALQTTNNRMEMTAAIEALVKLGEPCSVLIHTDSQLLMYCAQKKWKRKKNKDLWAVYDIASKNHLIKWQWVKGHSGDLENERADALATLGRKELMQCQ